MTVIREGLYVERVLAQFFAGGAKLKEKLAGIDALLIGVKRGRVINAGHYPHV
jgi:hypothetical protein